MRKIRPLRRGRILLTSALLGAGLLIGPLGIHPVGATFSTCTTDPKVFVSNGTKVTITPQINDDASDVSSIVYTVHGPVGTNATNVVYTGSVFTGKETVVYVADQPGSTTYLIDTAVTTATSSGVGVTVPVNILDTYDHVKTASAATGVSGQDVLLTLAY